MNDRTDPMTRSTLDRRRFLTLAGAGGAAAVGLAGLDLFAGAGSAAAVSDAISLGKQMNALFAKAHPGATWGGRCQQAQYYAEWAARGSESGIRAYSTATLAYQASRIVSTDPNAAPAGSFSYWPYYENGQNLGHVVTNIGNGYCINTSTRMAGHSQVEFGLGLRITRIADQPERPYLGWSLGNGTNGQIALTPWSPGGGTGGGGSESGPGWAFNRPDAATQKRIQVALAARHRYSGLCDGIWGINSIKGIQTTIKNVGYTGAVDGVPGLNTCHFVQVYAQKFGSYHGSVDNVLGPNGWNGFALGLERP